MLPLGLLNAAQGHPMLVELKNGETLNGHLIQCDTWMNLTLKEVIQTSPEADKFVRLPEVYVKGNNISRSNTYEYLTRSSTKSKISSTISRVISGAGAADTAKDEAIMVEEEATLEVGVEEEVKAEEEAEVEVLEEANDATILCQLRL
ncbi:putative small nuclear ribonucleo protein [Eutypa lata UCREL1]|uniref:LSM complex subunit LSM4 n=1 Tax=Eutypa lata (strain UCR-EL1) TaxID=1287681 RepID=M7TT40_EUTLA|nr:putative small nuclear ribonucleo protein [Eutypa lata UCREL1]